MRTVYKRNADERDDFIKKFGKERFEKVALTDKSYSKYILPKLPDKFVWIWSIFIDMWAISERDVMGNIIFTPGTVVDYINCFHVPISVHERHLLFRMKSWAIEEISALQKKDEE